MITRSTKGTGRNTASERAPKHVMETATLIEHPLLAAAATSVRVRLHQRLAVSVDQTETVYVVRSGLVALSTWLEGRRRSLLSLIYPGEIFRTSFAPPLADTALMALAAGEVLRLPWHAFDNLVTAEVPLGRGYERQVARQLACNSLHATVVATLTGEERVATFLVEQALRLGRRTSGGIAFDLPMTREDIADYLSLNADTLSRIMSRLKAGGLITVAGRGHALTREFDRLLALSPVAAALQQLHEPRF